MHRRSRAFVVVILVAATACTWPVAQALVGRGPECARVIPAFRQVQRDVLKAKEVRESGTAPVSDRPEETFLRLKRHADAFESGKQMDCADDSDRPVTNRQGIEVTTFAAEWAMWKERDASRARLFHTQEAEREQKAEKAREAREAHKERVEGLARQYGHRAILFDVGLTDTLEDLRNGATSLAEVRGVVIELRHHNDAGFTANQVLKRGNALYLSEFTDAVVWLRSYGDVIIEGSPLTSLNNHYVVIEGVDSYTSLAGPRQAFVVVPAW